MSAPFAPVDERLTVVSLCTGYGGLDSVLALVLGARTTATADNDPDVSKLLDIRFDVPNLGDIQRVDWTQVERPDVVCAGFPCQDISPAGKRQGIKPGTRSGLWTWIAYVIGVLQPTYVFIENSRGLTSAKAHSDVEQCPFCMGDGSRNPALRALGRVSGDLADLGYDSEWTCVRASDVGAPHERHRAFIWAWRRGVAADPRRGSVRGTPGDKTLSASESGFEISAGLWYGGQRVRVDDRDARAGSVADADDSTRAEQDSHQATGLEASRRDDARRRGDAAADPRRIPEGRGARSSATPVGGASSEPQRRDRAGRDAARREPAQHRVARRAPTAHAEGERLDGPGRARPRGAGSSHSDIEAADARSSRLEVGGVEPAGDERAPARRDDRDGLELVAWVTAANTHVERRARWQRVALGQSLGRTAARGPYEGDAPAGFVWVVPNVNGDDIDYSSAIYTWEAITGRPAPLPAVPNRRGDFRLNPRFSEWMMGLPDGWVTAIPDLSRTAMLRIIGNGLVPAQGVLALLQLLEASRDF